MSVQELFERLHEVRVSIYRKQGVLASLREARNEVNFDRRHDDYICSSIGFVDRIISNLRDKEQEIRAELSALDRELDRKYLAKAEGESKDVDSTREKAK